MAAGSLPPDPPRAARPRRYGCVRLLAAGLVAACAWSLGAPSFGSADDAEAPAPVLPERIVALNPSLSSILVALGAGDALVGVDDASSRALPSLRGLPRIGGLFNPSLEAVVALEPDLVVLVPSVEQRDFRTRLEALGVRVEAFPNESFGEVLATIDALGRRVGREAQATERIGAIERARRAVQAVAADFAAPRCLIVLQRDPLYVVGRGSFLAEMLGLVGGSNVASGFADAYPRVGIEWVVEAAPQLILDSSFDAEVGSVFWERWPSLPAVAAGRVVPLREQVVTLPGPRLDDALLLMLRAVHGGLAEKAARVAIAEAAVLESVVLHATP